MALNKQYDLARNYEVIVDGTKEAFSLEESLEWVIAMRKLYDTELLQIESFEKSMRQSLVSLT